MKGIKVHIVLCCQLLAGSLYAQALSDCQQDVQKFYKQNDAIKLDQGYYVKYGVQSIYKQKDISNKEVLFTLMFKNYQLHVISDVLNTYADTVSVISMSKLTKKIIIGNNSKKQFSKMLNSTTQLSDSSLWSNFEVATCKTIPSKKEYNHEVVLKPLKKNSAIKQIAYLYNQEASSLYKVTNSYTNSSELQELNYTFYKIDYAYNGSDIKSKNVKSIFFDNKGKLLPEFAGYEVIDQRNKK